MDSEPPDGCECSQADNAPQCCECDDIEMCEDIELINELEETVSAENQ